MTWEYCRGLRRRGALRLLTGTAPTPTAPGSAGRGLLPLRQLRRRAVVLVSAAVAPRLSSLCVVAVVERPPIGPRAAAVIRRRAAGRGAAAVAVGELGRRRAPSVAAAPRDAATGAGAGRARSLDAGRTAPRPRPLVGSGGDRVVGPPSAGTAARRRGHGRAIPRPAGLATAWSAFSGDAGSVFTPGGVSAAFATRKSCTSTSSVLALLGAHHRELVLRPARSSLPPASGLPSARACLALSMLVARPGRRPRPTRRARCRAPWTPATARRRARR